MHCIISFMRILLRLILLPYLSLARSLSPYLSFSLSTHLLMLNWNGDSKKKKTNHPSRHPAPCCAYEMKFRKLLRWLVSLIHTEYTQHTLNTVRKKCYLFEKNVFLINIFFIHLSTHLNTIHSNLIFCVLFSSFVNLYLSIVHYFHSTVRVCSFLIFIDLHILSYTKS